VEFYRNALLSEPKALSYATARGVSSSTLDRLHVGYCAGAGLVEYLRWLGLPTRSAAGAGLLRHDRERGLAERMAGRVVVPEMRAGKPVWLVGRAWDPPDAEPKYLCLAGSKPVLGWEQARHGSEVYITEGVFDWLILVEWDLPAVALVGAHARKEVREALRRFRTVYLALDTDEAGRTAAARLAGELAGRAVVVDLPGVKDVAELGLRPDGRDLFLEATRAAGTTGYERGGENARR
jgi:DNA primase